jgi:hypothetical protein
VRLLLDAQIVLWALIGSALLGAVARGLIADLANKIIPTLLMLAVSTGAIADWVLIYRYSDADVYADTASVSRVKEKSALWTVTDSRKDKDFLGTMYRSVRTQMEYDCARMTSLHVESRYYKGQMGQGEPSGTVPPAGGYFLGFSALPLQPDTPDEVAWKIACRRQ